MSASRTLRCAIPLGLNVGSPLANVSDSLRPPSIIPPPKDVREDETRRNTFWISELQTMHLTKTSAEPFH